MQRAKRPPAGAGEAGPAPASAPALPALLPCLAVVALALTALPVALPAARQPPPAAVGPVDAAGAGSGAGTFVALVGSISAPGTEPSSAAGPPGVLDDLYAPLLLPAGHPAGAAYRFSSATAPELATVTGNRGTYTVTLRRGVRACDGDELTAADVAFALRRAAAAAPGLGSWAAWHAAGMLGPLLGGRATAAGTLRVEGRYRLVLRPSPDGGMLPGVLAGPAAAPLDAALVERAAGPSDPLGRSYLATHDAGFGPYCLAAYRPGREVVLTANPHWTLAPRPGMRRVEVLAVGSSSRRLAEVESGAADAAFDLGRAQWAVAARSARVRALASPDTTGHLQLDLNFAVPPWGPNGSARASLMRLAVAAALPYRSVLAALGAAAVPWLGMVPPSIPGARADRARFVEDPALAASDLAAAGHAGGYGLPRSGLVLAYDPGVPAEGQIATVIAGALGRLGVTLTLRPVPGLTADGGATAGASSYPMALVTGGVTFPDAAWYSARWYASPATGGALDAEGYDDPALDALVAQAAGESGAARSSLAAREQSLELADLPVIPLAVLVDRVAVGRKVSSMALGGPGTLYAVTSLGGRG